jgi:hypothetical protein
MYNSYDFKIAGKVFLNRLAERGIMLPKFLQSTYLKEEPENEFEDQYDELLDDSFEKNPSQKKQQLFGPVQNMDIPLVQKLYLEAIDDFIQIITLFIVLHGSPIYIASLYHLANGFTEEGIIYRIWSIIAMPYAYVGTSQFYIVLSSVLKPVMLCYVIIALTYKLFKVEKRIMKYGHKGLRKVPRNTKKSKEQFEKRYGASILNMVQMKNGVSEVDKV